METPADVTWSSYSLAERDRRWAAVRKNAAEAGLDGVFVPLCVDPAQLYLSSDSKRGVRSDGRYLTLMESAAVVLPTDGRAPLVINDFGTSNHWITDARAANRGMRGGWGAAMIQALRDAGFEHARIGVAGLQRGRVTHARANDGVVNHSAYAEVVQAFPNATFVDATDVIGLARYIKSDEEIACLRYATGIAEAGVEEMVRVARPGVDTARVYARVTVRMLELGSERHDWAFYAAPLGEEAERYTDPPLGKRLAAGDYITNEVSAVWGGQLAQEDQPILLGAIPESWKPLVEAQREVWEQGLAMMKPGARFADLIDYVDGFGPPRGLRTGITMHGRGLGNEGPILTPATIGEGIREMQFQAGNTFVWKPSAELPDGHARFSWGGAVVVTPTGGERLFQRNHGIVTV